MIFNQLPSFIVAAPILIAAGNIALPAKLAKYSLLLIALLLLAASGQLLINALETNQVVYYHFGDWFAPIGISYRLDILSTSLIFLLMLIFNYIAFNQVTLNKLGYCPREYSLLLLLIAGLCGMIASDDLFNIYVFIEISSLASYCLIAANYQQKKGLITSFNYLIFGTTAASIYLIGIGILYSFTGTLNISDMAKLLPAKLDLVIVQFAMILIFIGLAMKAAIFPFSSWLINVYSHALPLAKPVIAGMSTKVALYLILRLSMTIFPKGMVLAGIDFYEYLQIMAVMMICYGSWQAVIAKQDPQRVLACSSITNLGYIILLLSCQEKICLIAAFMVLFNHALIKSAAFIYVNFDRNQFTISHKIVAIISWLAIIGIPGTAGFTAKWQLLYSLVNTQHYLFFALIIATSMAAVIYGGNNILTIYRQDIIMNKQHKIAISASDLTIFMPALIIIYAGIDSNCTLMLATKIVAQLWQ